MRYGARYGTSPWYVPGDWSLPSWWTDWPPARPGHRWTYQELETFYNGWFVTHVFKHEGGMRVCPMAQQILER